MAPEPPSQRLLQTLIKSDTSALSALTSLLAASHASHAALSAYASAHPPPLGDVLRDVENALRGVHEAVRAYAGAMEGWCDDLKELKGREEELGAVVRDRDILVGRLIKATRPTSTHSLLPIPRTSPHSSAASLGVGEAPKLAHAQQELQACETHLLQSQRALEAHTKASLARAVHKRCAALEVLAQACNTAAGEARGALGALVPAQYANMNGSPNLNPMDKPLPNPSPYSHGIRRAPSPSSQQSHSSLSPSQSASQIAAAGLPVGTTTTTNSQHRLSLRLPPAHAAQSTGFIPDSRLLPPIEMPGAEASSSRAQEHDDAASSSSDDPPVPLIAHENPPRQGAAALSFSPPPLPPHLPAASNPRGRTTTSRSDLGPARSRPPVVQARRPSSRSLDSYESPAPKKKGFFGAIARAFHFGGSSRGGRESPPYGASSSAVGGSAWGGTKRDRTWSSRTDAVIARQKSARRANESSDEDDEGRHVAVVENVGRPPIESLNRAPVTVGRAASKVSNGRAGAGEFGMVGNGRGMGTMSTMKSSDGMGTVRPAGTKKKKKLVKAGTTDSPNRSPQNGPAATPRAALEDRLDASLPSAARARVESSPDERMEATLPSAARARVVGSSPDERLEASLPSRTPPARSSTLPAPGPTQAPLSPPASQAPLPLSRSSTTKSTSTSKSATKSLGGANVNLSTWGHHPHSHPPAAASSGTARMRAQAHGQQGQESIMQVLEHEAREPVRPPRSAARTSAPSPPPVLPSPDSGLVTVHAPAAVTSTPLLHSPTATSPASPSMLLPSSTAHSPVPSASAPAPTRSALRSNRSPSPLPPPVPAPAARPPSAHTTASADDASSYETGHEDLDPELVESSDASAVGNTNLNVGGNDKCKGHERGPSMSTVSDSTEVQAPSSAPVTRRKSVRLDVPPSVTSTPAAVADAEADTAPWGDPTVPSISTSLYLPSVSGDAGPAVSLYLPSAPPPPRLPPSAPESEVSAGAAPRTSSEWQSRASMVPKEPESSDEDAEYARVKSALASVNRAWEQAGTAKRKKTRGH